MCHFRCSALVAVVSASLLVVSPASGDDGLVAHWKLAGDCKDHSGGNHHAINHGVRFGTSEGAIFNGTDAWLEVPASDSLRLGNGEFSITAWVHTESELDDVLGDLLSWYDSTTRTGMTLGLMNYAGVTSAQSNWRNVTFGIDAGRLDPKWTDCGRPGESHYVKSLVVFDGGLYAATWEPGEGQRGHVYRYAGGARWIDCGAPDEANAITGLAVFNGKLYAGSETYSGGGSSLPLSPNTKHGGRVYRYGGGTSWIDCGKVADVRSISGLAVFKGKLYAGTGTSGAWRGDYRETPRTRGMYRYDGNRGWTSCGCPGLRVTHLGVHNGSLFGLSYDDGGFFRYEGGDDWTRMGPVPETTQVYSMAVYEGRPHVGTWPTGSVYRMDGPNQQWTYCGRLGDDKEVMGMAVYNGKLYAGTLPKAEVYRYDGGTEWVLTGQLDETPNVRYRRAWSMAVFDGKLFCGVLPSGHVLSLEAGKCVTFDRALPAGWVHLTAVRGADHLRLYVNGKLVAKSALFNPKDFDISNDQPLKIGFGPHDYFNGKLKDLRLYRRALTNVEVADLPRETLKVK
ncbi:MAG TPA: LamG domain-containing protein [Planctomycetes bacterium]|nr:LamG domain-containing protein [Planctomycetota bacterium]